MPTFDPNADPAGGPADGGTITDAQATLYSMLGLGAVEGGAQVLLKRGKPTGPGGGGPTSPVQIPSDILAGAGYAHPDETSPMASVIQGFYRMPEDKRAQYQRQLLSGGFYTSTNNLIEGEPDNDTIRAFADAAKRSVVTGKTLDETISDAAGSVSQEDINKLFGAGGTAKKGSQAGARSVTPTHPDDIRMVAMKASREVLGKGWDASQLDRFVHAYQAMEMNAPSSGVAAPSPEAAAATEARRSNPVAAGATDLSSAYSMMVTAMKNMGAS